MSGYNGGGRRAPNVSQYLANLNQIPTGQEVQQDINFQDDLDFLTNTEFFDFDQFNQTGPAPAPFPAEDAAKTGQQFQYGADFNTFPSPTNGLPSPQNLQGAYPPQGPHFSQTSPATGDKRKASIAMPQPDLEEASRLAAEEDKRRRNTAASARFRVKKKQREQALEKDNKEMKERVQQLEGKVQQLEMENKWLKGLITDKSEKSGADAATAEVKKEKESEERSTGSRTDGVGTTAEGKGQEGEA